MFVHVFLVLCDIVLHNFVGFTTANHPIKILNLAFHESDWLIFEVQYILIIIRITCTLTEKHADKMEARGLQRGYMNIICKQFTELNAQNLDLQSM